MGIVSLASEELLPQVGELVVDKYRVLGALGAGGMGAVLEARHVSLGHKVALKVLQQLGTGEDEASLRFFREARATASLESEHVVRIFDLGTTERGLPFLVMERLSGFDLAHLLAKIGPLSPGLAVECVLQAARGVRQAHQAGIIHRDLKPSNLFLTRAADGGPLVKVLDFGISKLAGEDAVRLTHTRTVVGSPLYMSPEQVRDAREVDARTDVWSLGAILYELLGGRPAFDGDTLPSVYASIIMDEPRALTQAGVPPALSELVRGCLTKDRQHRVASADELIAALELLRPELPRPSLSELELPLPSRDREDDPSQPTTFPGVRPAVDEAAYDSIRTSATRKRLAPDATPTLSSGDRGPKPSGLAKRTWAVLIAVIALGVVAAFAWGRYERGQSRGAVNVVPRTYLLDLDTTPSGALVLERGRVLGRTPLRLPMSASDTQLRELVFEADGYLAHVARIEPLTADRSLAIALVPVPAPTAAAPQVATSTPVVTSVPRKSLVKQPASVRPREPAPSAPAATDIHLSR